MIAAREPTSNHGVNPHTTAPDRGMVQHLVGYSILLEASAFIELQLQEVREWARPFGAVLGHIKVRVAGDSVQHSCLLAHQAGENVTVSMRNHHGLTLSAVAWGSGRGVLLLRASR